MEYSVPDRKSTFPTGLQQRRYYFSGIGNKLAGTIVVFAREPVPGRTKTRLIPVVGAVNAALLADAFLRDTIAKVRDLGRRPAIAASTKDGVGKSEYFQSLAKTCDVDLVDQSGGDLGIRMARALERYAQDGAAILGSDIPSLPTSRLELGLQMLSEFDLVLGPALDGGYFLIGARGAVPKIFNGVQWGGPRVLAHTISHLRRSGIRYGRVPFWYDVDSGTDLRLLSAHLSGRGRIGGRLPALMPLERASPCPVTAALLRRLGL
jgi:rSAM/selenodomain-associated transferase 1